MIAQHASRCPRERHPRLARGPLRVFDALLLRCPEHCVVRLDRRGDDATAPVGGNPAGGVRTGAEGGGGHLTARAQRCPRAGVQGATGAARTGRGTCHVPREGAETAVGQRRQGATGPAPVASDQPRKRRGVGWSAAEAARPAAPLPPRLAFLKGVRTRATAGALPTLLAFAPRPRTSPTRPRARGLDGRTRPLTDGGR